MVNSILIVIATKLIGGDNFEENHHWMKSTFLLSNIMSFIDETMKDIFL